VKQNEHFNKLSPARQERLAKLAEECGEVVQVVGKILCHGMQSCSPLPNPEGGRQPTNEELLEKELGDLKWITSLMVAEGDVSLIAIDWRVQEKGEKAKPYLHHQTRVNP
jgi:hypothetical protein